MSAAPISQFIFHRSTETSAPGLKEIGISSPSLVVSQLFNLFHRMDENKNLENVPIGIIIFLLNQQYSNG